MFDLVFAVAAPFWALMILAPHWRHTARIVGSPLIVLPPVLIYLVVVAPALGDILPAVAAPSLDGIKDLLATDAGTLAIWAHVIAFDLFVGRWIHLDARERRITAWLTSPLLVVTILLAPVGLAAYLAARAVRAPGPVPSLG